MKCKEAEGFLIPYMDEKLAPRERAEVDLHLRACSSCAERAKGFTEVSGLLDAWEGIEPSPFFNARLERRIEQDAVSAGWLAGLGSALRNLPLGRPAFATAMVAVIFLAVVLVGYSPSTGESLAGREQQQMVASMAIEMDELVPVLEDWELLRNFEVLQELSIASVSQP
ncbi:MAG: zf-HC2 domain-containing protein [Acidobacteria bacterium]|nr:zf-HC2 domain-containing protein [Acidobacteriota bacterium]